MPRHRRLLPLFALAPLCVAWCGSVSAWSGAPAARQPSPSRDGVMDLSSVRRQVSDYCSQLQVKGKPFGTFRRSARRNARATLYASCDVAWIRACMGEDLKKTLSDRRRREWIDVVNGYANDDGSYSGGNHSLQHANGMVIGALCVLGGQQKHPVRLYEEFDESAEIGLWLEKIRWERQWDASHLFWGGMHCYSLSRRCSPKWRTEVFDWLDANLDAKTGWWRKGVPQAGRQIEVLGGAAHIWPMYEHHRRRFPHPERVIDSILALQRPDGCWLNFANYMELDALYGLAYMQSQAPDYRADDVASAVRRHGRLVQQKYSQFLPGRPDAHIVLAVVGTLGLLQHLDPESYRDTVRWSDIFRDVRFYQTSAVEVISETRHEKR